jgi:hypothetical protein
MGKMKKKFGFIALSVILVLALSACGNSKPEQAPIPVDSPPLDSAETDEEVVAPAEPDADAAAESGEEVQEEAAEETAQEVNPDFVSLQVAQDFPFAIGNARVFAQFGEYGVIRVTGVIQHEFPISLVNVAIRGNLKDSAGNLITTMETLIYNRVLHPGENGLFDLHVMTADHGIEPGNYVVEITQWTYEEATDEMIALDYSSAIETGLESVANDELTEGMSYEGLFSVENAGDQTAASVLVACIYGSDENEILFVTVEDIGEMPPGESIAYRCGITFPADIFEVYPMTARIDHEVAQVAIAVDAIVK